MAKAKVALTKRCSVCGRFRTYAADDEYCVVCGHQALEDACACGRDYAYALHEQNDAGTLHCPRCGKSLRGRSSDFEP